MSEVSAPSGAGPARPRSMLRTTGASGSTPGSDASSCDMKRVSRARLRMALLGYRPANMSMAQYGVPHAPPPPDTSPLPLASERSLCPLDLRVVYS